jgi:hypothetical protein
VGESADADADVTETVEETTVDDHEGHIRPVKVPAAPTSTVTGTPTTLPVGPATPFSFVNLTPPTSTTTPTSTTPTVTPPVNHGNCVSFAAHIASSLGFSDDARDQFISAVARDDTAVSAKVPDGGKPDAACQSAIDKAKASVTASAQTEEHPDTPTSTATAKHRRDDHPDAETGDRNDAPTPPEGHRPDATSRRGND